MGNYDHSTASWGSRNDFQGPKRLLYPGLRYSQSPKLARLDGIEAYKGHMFHTSRWDYAYTGGTPENSVMDKLVGKKVAFIGTGATAVQAILQLAKTASHLYVFQQTLSAIDANGQCLVDPAQIQREVHTGKGWQQSRRENIGTTLNCLPRTWSTTDGLLSLRFLVSLGVRGLKACITTRSAHTYSTCSSWISDRKKNPSRHQKDGKERSDG
jgi:hypothetical protein